MSGRAAKQLKRLSTDSEDQDEIDWSDPRQRRDGARKSSSIRGTGAAARSKNVGRPSRRNVSEFAKATVSRDPPSSLSNPQSLRLTVKMSSTKLRQATGGNTTATRRGASARESLVGGEIIEGKRARNVKKSYVVESDSEDEDEEMEDLGDDEDAEGESVEEEDAMDEDAEGDLDEDADADGDIDMEIPPLPPTIKISKAERVAKSSITVKASGRNDSKTSQRKDTQESDDEELSELESSPEEEEEEEEEEGMQLGNEEDAEGEDEDIEEVDDEEEEEEEDLDSDDETPGGGSRASTPDLTKLTKRQRARLEEGGGGHLLALPDEVQVKKHLTAEEHAMRRAEMARRRKNLSEKRNEEEKMETINKLLKKQAPKTNARRRDFNSTVDTPDGEPQKPNPIFVRWISNKEGNQIGVPEEWIESPVGGIFVGRNGVGQKLIEEVQ